MTDPIATQAELDAREDIHRDERHRLALENAALRVELAQSQTDLGQCRHQLAKSISREIELEQRLNGFLRATTIPAPPLTEWPSHSPEVP
jgi:hypothetical protein